MKSIFCLVATVLAVANAQATPGNIIRFLVLPKTTTATVTATVTTTLPTSVTQSCATTLASLTVCRKRRSFMESPALLDDQGSPIAPTQPDLMEISAVPESRSYGMSYGAYGLDAATQSRETPIHPVVPAAQAIAPVDQKIAPVPVESSIENTAGMAEIQIRDLDAVCRSRTTNAFLGVGLAQLLGITLLYSTTVTTNVTSTAYTTTVVKNNTFTIQGCLPSPLPFTLC